MKHSEIRQKAVDYIKNYYGDRVKILTPEDYPYYIIDYGGATATKYDILNPPDVIKWSDKSPRMEDYSVSNYSGATLWKLGKDFNKDDYKPIKVDFINAFISTEVGIRVEFIVKFREGDKMENRRTIYVPESYRDFSSSDTVDTFNDLFNQL